MHRQTYIKQVKSNQQDKKHPHEIQTYVSKTRRLFSIMSNDSRFMVRSSIREKRLMDPPAYHSEKCIDEKMIFATLDTSYKQIDFVGTEKITLFRLLLTKASSVMASFVFV